MRRARPTLLVATVTVLLVATAIVAFAQDYRAGTPQHPKTDRQQQFANRDIVQVGQNLCRSSRLGCTGTDNYGGGWTGVADLEHRRIGTGGHSDYFPPSIPRGTRSGAPRGGPSGGPPPCVPSWSTSTSAPQWIESGGSYFYGTVTTGSDGCGGTSISRTPICYLQDCVDTATAIAWNKITPKITGADPQISTSPDPDSLVHVATWFWHDEWRTFTETGAHPSAPVTVTVDAVPHSTNWDHGQGNFTCTGQPEPFDFGLLAYDEDPDADCNSHRYTYPSLKTGPSGENAYEISAQVRYRRMCTVTGAPAAVTPALCANPNQLYTGAPVGRTLLPVYELQGVLRG